MARAAKKAQATLTNAQQLGSLIKSARDIMRKDKGLNGDLDRLPITQDLVARSLGVRRPTVSCAFKDLEAKGVFAKERGEVRILDRPRLERIACRCYRSLRAQTGRWDLSKAKRKVLVTISTFFAALEVELLAN